MLESTVTVVATGFCVFVRVGIREGRGAEEISPGSTEKSATQLLMGVRYKWKRKFHLGKETILMHTLAFCRPTVP